MGGARVLVVDDSVVVRRFVSDVLSGDPGIDVVGTAAHGGLALAKIPLLEPDLVLLDVEMPVMDGLATLRELRRRYPSLPVVMFSTVTERGARVTVEALALGASDYVAKPANLASLAASRELVRAELVPRILALTARSAGPGAAARAVVTERTRLAPTPTPTPTSTPAPVATGVLAASRPAGGVDAVVIGASTGGPDALAQVLAALPPWLPVPVVVVQHMPPIFTRHFANRLDAKCRLTVKEAEAGDQLRAGHVLIAPGDHHLRLSSHRGVVTAALDQGPPESFCRPAVDVLFRSAAAAYGRKVLAVVLTGMGSDGARGAGDVVAAGGTVLVQDEATSVVWGMPGAVWAAGVPCRQLPLDTVAPAIVGEVTGGRSAGAGAAGHGGLPVERRRVL